MHVALRCSFALLLAACSAASLAAPASFADAVLADDPIAYWRFGEAPGASTALLAGLTLLGFRLKWGQTPFPGIGKWCDAA